MPKHAGLLSGLNNSILRGLNRKAIRSCSDWALQYRVMGPPYPGPWTFAHHPWLRGMHDSEAEHVVGRKAAQMGYSEYCLNTCLYRMDMYGESVLYVLPTTDPDASGFSSSRFDPALELSEHLEQMFTDVKNVGHKRAGTASLFVRGSKSRSQMKTLPVGVLILDEMAEMEQKNVPLAVERLSGQVNKKRIDVSTPTHEGKNIDEEWQNSSQNYFHFKCPCCGRSTQLTYPECLVIIGDSLTDPRLKESYIQCKECKGRLNHSGKPEWLSQGFWVPSYQDRPIEGFYVSQLYSMTISPSALAESYFRAQTNLAHEQEFYNSKLGLPHTPEGARITDNDIASCIGDYKRGTTALRDGVVTMGVDVGKWLHFEICQWRFDKSVKKVTDLNLLAVPRVIMADKVKDFEQLDQIMAQYKVKYTIVDAQPEKRKAIEFCQRHHGRARICYYSQGIGRIIRQHKDDPAVTVDRTTWMDLALGRFYSRKIVLPIDICNEYKEHLKTPVRLYKEDKDGNPVGRYQIGENDQDHFAHSRTYCEIALLQALGTVGNSDIIG